MSQNTVETEAAQTTTNRQACRFIGHCPIAAMTSESPRTNSTAKNTAQREEKSAPNEPIWRRFYPNSKRQRIRSIV